MGDCGPVFGSKHDLFNKNYNELTDIMLAVNLPCNQILERKKRNLWHLNYLNNNGIFHNASLICKHVAFIFHELNK